MKIQTPKKEFLGNPVLQSFNLCETSAPEIFYQMGKINPKKSTGSDDLPGKFINISAPFVADTLSKLFNLSIRNGEYPDVLKIAKVIPIYKKGEHTDINNYRPINILTHLKKIYGTYFLLFLIIFRLSFQNDRIIPPPAYIQIL